MRVRPGGNDWESFSALSESSTVKVYKYRLQRILNFVHFLRLAILTDLASFLRAFWRKSRMSVICFGWERRREEEKKRRREEGGEINKVRHMSLGKKWQWNRWKLGTRVEGESSSKGWERVESGWNPTSFQKGTDFFLFVRPRIKSGTGVLWLGVALHVRVHWAAAAGVLWRAGVILSVQTNNYFV